MKATGHSIRVTHPKMGFSAAHFVVSGDECEALHGHNYQVEAVVSGGLDDGGMVMDFRNLKDEVARACHELDHRVLLPAKSHSIQINAVESSVKVVVDAREYVFPGQDCVMLPIEATTAELLAEHLAKQIHLRRGLQVTLCVSESAGSSGCYYMET